jgi:hypothetical protein
MGRLLDRRIAWMFLLIVTGWLACSALPAAEQPGSTSDSQSVPAVKPASPAPAVDTSDPKRKKLVDTVFRKIGSLKPSPNPKKDLDDYFLVGTAELTLATGHADVRFEVKQGQQATAEFLVDYVLGAPEKTIRKWHVFSRVKDAQQGETAVAQIRMQYDQAVAYQEQLKQIYSATTIRRC